MKKLLFSLLICFLFSFSVFGGDYYWVGGSGNWNEIDHWRTTSGGTSIPNVVPGPTDDVYFDDNSGFTASSKVVTLNVAVNCRNITFSGSGVAPTVTSTNNANSLNIYGSSVWQIGMSMDVYQINYQDTGSRKSITSNGVQTGNANVYFYETSSISLQDDFKVSYLYVVAGTWNTNETTE